MFYHHPQQGGFLNRFFSFMFSKQAVSRLILFNTIVFILVLLNGLNDFLFKLKNVYPDALSALAYYLALPADINQLAARPWTAFTAMFLHSSFWHFLLNMLMLYFSGVIFLSVLNNRKLWISYFIGGLSGAVAFVAAYNFFPVFENIIPISYAIGASAAVMAVLFTVAAYAPNMSLRLFLFGQIQLKYLALIFVLIDVLSITASNPGGHIAHLGGALFGVIYGLWLKSSSVGGFSMNARLKKMFKRKPKMKARVNNHNRPESDVEYRNRRAADNKRVDAILDKISKGGYDSLTKEEKDFLFRHGRK